MIMSRTVYSGAVTSTDGKQTVFFITASLSRSPNASVTAVSSNEEIWMRNYTSEEWKELLKEEEISSTSELFKSLDSHDTKVSVEFSADVLKLSWSAVDEDGLYAEIFAVELMLRKDVGIFAVLKELLTITETLHSRAVNAENQLEIVDSKLDVAIERVNELQMEKNSLENSLITKFASIMAAERTKGF